MNRLQISHYRMVQAIRTHGTVSAAAQAVGLTQSALSHQIAEAERRLGRKLFARVGRRLSLTAAGEFLASSAETILSEASLAESTLMADEGLDPIEVVRIGTFAYNSYRWLPRFLLHLQQQRPNLYFEFVTDTSKVPMHSVLDGDVDIAIAAGRLYSGSAVVTHLFADELVAICASDHHLAQQTCVEVSDFLKDPFITYSTRYETGFEQELLWRPTGYRPRNYLRAGNTEAVIEMVKVGFGLSILSRWAVAPYVQDKQLAMIPITSAGLPMNWSAVVRKSHQQVELLTSISEQLQAWCSNQGHIDDTRRSAK
ncbi:MAG: LysR family transcriptional regulator [Gammaproteobacteria bacterium]|jgi:LysR family transcriptional regulator for metE and metH|nr:LysR family transcriptional regulator [Gammaproteobacteria bacterium]